MCDTVAGELILCFPRVDIAGSGLIQQLQDGKIEHVKYVDSLDGRLHSMGLRPDEGFPFEVHLVRVPSGSEAWKTSYLQFFYKLRLLEVLGERRTSDEFFEALGRSDYQFTVAPNFYLGLASGSSAPLPVNAATFHFSAVHQTYERLLNRPYTPPPGMGDVRVLILDTGLARDAATNLRVAAQKNFVDPANSQDTTDENGHGTAVALVIHDVAPTAEMIIYKVADATGRATEWDTLAALVADMGAHVINISLCFGLQDALCPHCGRQSMSSRSAVFENVIGQLPQRSIAPLVVAAAGNQAKGELSFPARFDQVLAISSVTSQRELSSFSNYGDIDQVGEKHRKHFAAPGGESRGPSQEFIGNYGAGSKGLCGTSYSAAYASGVVANLWGEQGVGTPASTIVDILTRRANRAFPGYDPRKYGNGIVRI